MDAPSNPTTLTLDTDDNETDTDYSSSSFTSYPPISPDISTPNISTPPETMVKNVQNQFTSIIDTTPLMKIIDATTNYSQSDSDEPLTTTNNISCPISDSDDSFAYLSENEVYKKLIRRLTTDEHNNAPQNEKRSNDKSDLQTENNNHTFNVMKITEYTISNIQSEMEYISEYEADNEDDHDTEIVSIPSNPGLIQSISNMGDCDDFNCSISDID